MSFSQVFLIQENNRLEVENKALAAEVASARERWERETDTAKIKAKIIDDQAETMRKLKSGLVERDEQLKQTRDEALGVQKLLEQQLGGEMDACNELRVKLDKCTERKEALKSELEAARTNLAETRAAYDELTDKWAYKSELIGELDVKVRRMKENFETREDAPVRRQAGCARRTASTCRAPASRGRRVHAAVRLREARACQGHG